MLQQLLSGQLNPSSQVGGLGGYFGPQTQQGNGGGLGGYFGPQTPQGGGLGGYFGPQTPPGAGGGPMGALLPYIQALLGQMTPTGQATGATGQPNWLQALLGPAGQQQSSLDPMAAFWQQLMGSLLSPQNMPGGPAPTAAPAAVPQASVVPQTTMPQRQDSGDPGTGNR